MVATSHPLATQIGIDILKSGGNAIDAAVAVGFALAVTSSGNGNIGGGGFLVAYKIDGTTFTIDHREVAPSKSSKDMFLDDFGNVIPGESLYTRAGSGVPGTVEGLIRAFEDHGSGKLSLQEILKPAIKLSEEGFYLSYYEAQRLNAYKSFFEKNKAAKKIFTRQDNQPWKENDKLVQLDLSKTLKRIARHGRDGFYTGPVAKMVVEEMKRGNGLISMNDLASYTSKYRTPVKGTYKGYDIISMGPPSSGGTLLVNMLNMLENFSEDSLKWNSSDYVHVMTEIQRRAYSDRAKHMGDPDYWEVPLGMFKSKEYAKIRSVSYTHLTLPTKRIV